ncbi:MULTISPECIES: hypothetical protein [Vitreoscilla]|uniref:Peptidase n=1 Tax=Vitreoscilla stercoraria TaxID=61 RepID=A0ABY4EBK9_VITST|nr:MULTISPECIES: hypothetical protein [Vitreoscilla]AUZ04027.1 putative protease [Vitreoscilla sp. C1]UOO93127.1 peptidase [Vitreoscilla stercoraria]
MTYCVALNLQDGMIFASDTRTNAGVDHISTFKKMFRFERADERVIFILTSGNLATSQAVIEDLQQNIHNHVDKHVLNAPTLFDVAQLIGLAVSSIANNMEQLGHTQNNAMFGSHFLVGGQIRGQAPKLYYVYPEGNFITATEDTPFFQIGESKYGKPILDRAVHYQTPLQDAVRAVLVSFDSTIRSNLSVGFPIDMVVYPKDSLSMPEGARIERDEPYMKNIREQWGDGLINLLKQFDMPPEQYLN